MTEEARQTNEKKKKKKQFSKDYIWTFTTYFTEGFPYIIIRTVSSVFFRDMKVSLEAIGLVNLFGLPWVLKFLWGPWVDEYSTKRLWLLTMQTILLVILGVAAFVVPLSNSVQLVAALFFIGAFIAATHDIAIDGYYMEALDKDGQAKFVGYRTMAYRIAMMTGTGVIVTIAAVVGWSLGFLVAAAIFGMFFLYHVFFLKEVETRGKKIKHLLMRALHLKTFLFAAGMVIVVIAVRYFFQSPFYKQLKEQLPLLKKIGFSHWVALLLLLILFLVGIFRKRIKALIIRDPESHYSRAFLYFMERDKVAFILAFIILLRVGEWTLSTMVAPFMVDLGIKIHYGWISAIVGLPASIAGAMMGGWMISRYSLKKVMWPFIMAQNFTNIIYMALALHLASFIKISVAAAEPVGGGAASMALASAAHGFHQFTAGTGAVNMAMAILPTSFIKIITGAAEPLGSEAFKMMLGAAAHGFHQCSGGLEAASMGRAVLHISFIEIVTGVKIITAAAEPAGIGAVNLALVAATHGFDQFAGGLGTAVLMTYLMRICHKEFKAAHYAIGTALMNISAIFAGVVGGIIAGWLGYAWLFGLSFVASVPAMLLIPFLPYVSDNENKATDKHRQNS
ncbi:MAG: MFS transporter [Candidatus Aminicenantes bacterium]|nr:MAG: MFS transporter [Candidatus Aminicenantes bacterium]